MDYLDEKMLINGVHEVKIILNFLDEKMNIQDEYISSLITTGCLETADNKIYIKEIYDLMPGRLKSVFTEYFLHYLK